jgi:hypothetical protein
MPIIVCMTKYRSRSKYGRFAENYPLSTKNKPHFAKVVDKIIMTELAGKSVSSLLHKSKPALEVLVHLQVVKYIVSGIFKGFTNVLVNLLKARPSLGEPPSVPSTCVADPSEFYRDHYMPQSAIPANCTLIWTFPTLLTYMKRFMMLKRHSTRSAQVLMMADI